MTSSGFERTTCPTITTPATAAAACNPGVAVPSRTTVSQRAGVQLRGSRPDTSRVWFASPSAAPSWNGVPCTFSCR